MKEYRIKVTVKNISYGDILYISTYYIEHLTWSVDNLNICKNNLKILKNGYLENLNMISILDNKGNLVKVRQIWRDYDKQLIRFDIELIDDDLTFIVE